MSRSVTVSCANCEKVYSLPRSLTAEYRGLKNNYCSSDCYQAYRQQNVTVICAECETPFEVWRSRFERGNVSYCSRKCSNRSRGEHLKKVNPNQKNRVHVTCETCKMVFEEVPSRIEKNSRFCSSKCYGSWREKSGISKGKRNPQYRDGSTMRTYERLRRAEWKRIADSIREERGNQCEKCGKVGNNRKLPVHHKIPWEVSNDDSPNNLMVVCQSCHVQLERLFYEKGITSTY